MTDVETWIPVDHPSLAAHFPGNPVVPAVVLMERVVAEAMRLQAATGEDEIVGVRSAKFLRLLRPEEPFRLSLRPGRRGLAFTVSTVHPDAVIARGELETG